MALDLCTITGTIHYPDGTLAAGEVLRIVKAVKNGKLISSALWTTPAANNVGVITFDAPRDSIIWVWADIVGFNTNASQGVPLAIPDASTGTLETLSPVTLAPNTVPVVIGGGGGGSATTVWGETPTGTVNGSNATFTTAHNFVPGQLEVFVNGVRQKPVTHFNTSGLTTILFSDSPITGDQLQINYERA